MRPRSNMLRNCLADPASEHRLEFLWTLHGLAALDERQILDLMSDADEYLRVWAVRIAAGHDHLSSPLFDKSLKLAACDSSVVVRSQLAGVAQRLPGEQALRIIERLVMHDTDADDLQIPLLLWWALERQASNHESILAWLGNRDVWQRRLFREHLAARIAQRWATTGQPAGRAACSELLALAPTRDDRQVIVQGMNLGLRGQHFDEPPSELASNLNKIWHKRPHTLAVLELGLRLGMAEARFEAASIADDKDRSNNDRLAAISLVGETVCAGSVGLLQRLVETRDAVEPIRLAAMMALAKCDDQAIGPWLLSKYSGLPKNLKPRTLDILAARNSTARLLLDAIEAGDIPPGDVTIEQIRQIAAHKNAELDESLTHIWGKVRAATPEERLAVVRRLNNDLRAAVGDPRAGQLLFREHCGKCHKLFGEGNEVGPDLTSANRGDRTFLLVSLVDPNAQIRKEYLNYSIQMRDGRVLTGLIADDSGSALTLIDATNERPIVSREDIEVIEPATNSLMPEGLLEKLTPRQLRDLFSYLQGAGPVSSSEPKVESTRNN